jgi:WD40 repeat protein
MAIFSNENILSLVFKSCTLYSIQKTFKQIQNKIICKIILKSLSYNKMYKSLKESSYTLPLERDTDIIKYVIQLPNGNMLTISNSLVLTLWGIDEYKFIREIRKDVYKASLLNDNTAAVYNNKGFINLLSIKDNLRNTNSLYMEHHCEFIEHLHTISDWQLACCVTNNVDYETVIIVDCQGSTLVDLQTESNASSLTNLTNGQFAGSIKDYITIWDVDEGEILYEIEGHRGWITSLIFIDKYNLLISGSNDKTIRVWNGLDIYNCIR